MVCLGDDERDGSLPEEDTHEKFYSDLLQPWPPSRLRFRLSRRTPWREDDMKKIAALAFVAALGFSEVPQDASAAPVSSGALDLLMNSEALHGGRSGETINDGLVQPAQSSEQVPQDDGLKVKGALQYSAPTAAPVEDWPEAPADGANVRGQGSGNLPAAKERRVSPRRSTLSQRADGAASVTRRRGYTYYDDARYYSYRPYRRGYYRRGTSYDGSMYASWRGGYRDGWGGGGALVAAGIAGLALGALATAPAYGYGYGPYAYAPRYYYPYAPRYYYPAAYYHGYAPR